MPYCKYCGFKLPDDARFCPNCGASVPQEVYELKLADWGERILAYLIDTIILGLIVVPIVSVLSWPWAYLVGFRWTWNIFASYGLSNVISFLYWTFMEGIFGQSVGKIALKMKVVKVNGEPIDIVTAAIESLGKAFLLPIDLILGLLLYPQKRQRLFNYISNTVVIKVH